MTSHDVTAVTMTSRTSAVRDPTTEFPNSSPALFGSGSLNDHTAMNGKGASMLSDMRNFPSEKRKNKPKNKMMTSLAHPDLSPMRSLSLEDAWDPGFVLSETFGQGSVCACVRSTTRLHDPSTWRHLEDVQELTIEDEDDAVKMMPAELYSLQQLRVLTVRWSGLQFVGAELAALPLTQLHLTNNKLQTLPSALTTMNTLTVLNLAANAIHTLPADIGNLSFLRQLNLAGNQLTQLPDSISGLQLLEELTLTSNRLAQLPPAVGALCELRLLDASLNKLTSLPAEIGALHNLVTLILSYNKLTHIPEAFSRLSRLQWMFLRKNRFSEVPVVLLALPGLEVLNMNENRISTVAAPSPYLQHLLLDANKLTSIPDNILACPNLRTLSLQRNSIHQVPPDIRRLASLRALHLGGNLFEEVPQDLGELQDLRHLALNDNKIEHLPSKMESLRRLSVLNLDNTHINGAWMSAYRQGIPAVLEYARTIRQRAEAGTDLPPTPKRNGHLAKPPPDITLTQSTDLESPPDIALTQPVVSQSPRASPRQTKSTVDEVEERQSAASRPSPKALRRISERAKPVEEISRPKSSPFPLRSED